MSEQHIVRFADLKAGKEYQFMLEVANCPDGGASVAVSALPPDVRVAAPCFTANTREMVLTAAIESLKALPRLKGLTPEVGPRTEMA
jgi:hypothetical protein